MYFLPPSPLNPNPGGRGKIFFTRFARLFMNFYIIWKIPPLKNFLDAPLIVYKIMDLVSYGGALLLNKPNLSSRSVVKAVAGTGK